MRLYLVRHGQSTGNVGGTLMGQSDHPLTELGEEQARAAAARLAPFGPMPVHCSDLPRAVATAERIVGAWAEQPDPGAALAGVVRARPRVLPDPRLREIDLGDYEGRSWEEFEADTALTDAFAADPYGTALPGGESLAHLEARVMAAVRDVLAAHGAAPDGGLSTDAVVASDASALASGFHTAETGQNVCVVAHDGPIRAILNHYLGVPPEKWWTLSTTHGGVSLLEFGGGWVNVRYANATSHLAGLGETVYVPSEPDDEPAAG
ncbi:MAG: histidine phosphatase family protein [Actinobacteria bacterium]|nr:histidine phosphatase family protein [Actinomycetota bacterium]